MSRRTLVFFICSPHSRTGVTTAARLLTDYYLSRGVPVEGFDTDSREPCYALRFPHLSRVVDLYDVRGQISLFDRLLVADGAPKIVDVWSRAFDQFFATIAEIGFLDEAGRAGVEPIVLYQSDSTATAASNARLLNTTWPKLWLTAIHNEGSAPLAPHAHEILSHYAARGKLVIPRLESAIAETLKDSNLSFADFLAHPPPAMSIVLRAALKAWLVPIFTQFQSLELRLDLQSSEFL
jgi:hypothetical protein